MPSVIYNTPTSLPVRKPAPFVIGPTNKAPFRPTNKIPQDVIDTAQATPIEEFDAQKHVNFEFPKRTYTMKEWGYENQGVSPIAASDPFSLFTEAAVKQVRRELLSEEVLRTCQYASTFTKNQIRGYTQKFITPDTMIGCLANRLQTSTLCSRSLEESRSSASCFKSGWY